MCGLTNTDIPESVEGINWVDGLQMEEEPRKYLYFAFKELLRGVKDRQYKLIEYMGNGTDAAELFDLENDPWEMNNLAGDPSMKDVLTRLRTQLFQMRDEWDDRDHPLGKIFWDDYAVRRGIS